MRINKFVALALAVARRAADDFVLNKQIHINSKPATMGASVGEEDEVDLVKDGTTRRLAIPKATKAKVVLVYKPIRVLTSNEAEKGHETVYDKLPAKYKDFKFAGRLDLMSEGLLVFSNDGGVINHLTHPRYGNHKKYLVVTDRPLKPIELEKLQQGVEIDGYLTRPSVIKPLMQSPVEYRQYSFLGITPHQPAYCIELGEGRNQQIRKMLFTVGARAKRLIRVQFGRYKLTSGMLKGAVVELDYTPSPVRNKQEKQETIRYRKRR